MSLNNATCHLKPGNTQGGQLELGVLLGFPHSLYTVSSIEFQGPSTLSSKPSQQDGRPSHHSIYWSPGCSPQGHLKITQRFPLPAPREPDPRAPTRGAHAVSG